MDNRFEVILSTRGNTQLELNCYQWQVQKVGGDQVLLKLTSYRVACAIARHFNGHDPEPGDIEALISFATERSWGVL